MGVTDHFMIEVKAPFPRWNQYLEPISGTRTYGWRELYHLEELKNNILINVHNSKLALKLLCLYTGISISQNHHQRIIFCSLCWLVLRSTIIQNAENKWCCRDELKMRPQYHTSSAQDSEIIMEEEAEY